MSAQGTRDAPSPVKAKRGQTAVWLLLRFIRWTLGLTLRERMPAGADVLRSMQTETRPMVLAYWHDRTFMASDFIQERLNRKGVHLTLMASRSRDGGLVARLAEGWNIDVIRGSASNGGATALRAMVKAVKRQKTSPIIVPDGPRGPIYRFKGGAAMVSQLTGEPVLPMGFAAERFWRIKSWDRMIIPKPFSRVFVVFGEPTVLPRKMSPDEMEAHRLALEKAINRVTRQAEEAAGGVFPDPAFHPGVDAEL